MYCKRIYKPNPLYTYSAWATEFAWHFSYWVASLTRQCLQSGLTLLKWVTMRIRYGKRQQMVEAKQANRQRTMDSRQQPAPEPMLHVCRKPVHTCKCCNNKQAGRGLTVSRLSEYAKQILWTHKPNKKAAEDSRYCQSCTEQRLKRILKARGFHAVLHR